MNQAKRIHAAWSDNDRRQGTPAPVSANRRRGLFQALSQGFRVGATLLAQLFRQSTKLLRVGGRCRERIV